MTRLDTHTFHIAVKCTGTIEYRPIVLLHVFPNCSQLLPIEATTVSRDSRALLPSSAWSLVSPGPTGCPSCCTPLRLRHPPAIWTALTPTWREPSSPVSSVRDRSSRLRLYLCNFVLAN